MVLFWKNEVDKGQGKKHLSPQRYKHRNVRKCFLKDEK